MSKQVFLGRTGKMGNNFKILMFLQRAAKLGRTIDACGKVKRKLPQNVG